MGHRHEIEYIDSLNWAETNGLMDENGLIRVNLFLKRLIYQALKVIPKRSCFFFGLRIFPDPLTLNRGILQWLKNHVVAYTVPFHTRHCFHFNLFCHWFPLLDDLFLFICCTSDAVYRIHFHLERLTQITIKIEHKCGTGNKTDKKWATLLNVVGLFNDND